MTLVLVAALAFYAGFVTLAALRQQHRANSWKQIAHELERTR